MDKIWPDRQRILSPLPSADLELADARAWLDARLGDTGHQVPPFSLTYAGRPLAELLSTWPVATAMTTLDERRTQHTVIYSDPATGLIVRWVAVAYVDFPTVEWTLFLKNGGTANTPILAEVQAIDTSFERTADGEFVLHHAVGSPARADDYRPLETALRPGSETPLATRGGRSSDTVLPYFNLAWSGAGVIVAVGWPGQWAARFMRDGGIRVRLWAGQELTHFVLRPGEEVRSPLIALQFYRGDWIHGQNVWRRWMIAHNLPRIDGQVPLPFISAGSSNQFHEMEQADEENQKVFIDRYLDAGIPIDLWWMDAGWYATSSGKWTEVGTWEVDRRRFPRGLRAVTDHAHQKSLKALVWFEPERVAPGTWLDKNHPEWLLEIPGGRWKVLDLGVVEAREWVVEHVDQLIREQGVDLYRQDFNVAPLDYWRANDPPDRQGITEIRHVTGYLAFWDELRRRHPRMLLDTCASGGRRLDLETLRRSVPLHKSDHDYRDFAARQCQAYGIAFWIPFHGAPVCRIDQVDPYAFRSAVGLMVGLGFDVRRKDLDYQLLRQLAREWRKIASYSYGDYYPLTTYSVDEGSWLAWQYDRPDLGEGLIQAFRRAASPYVSAKLPLHGLDPSATYRLINVDEEGHLDVDGRDLLENGLSLTIPNPSTAVIITYTCLAS